MQLIGKQQYAYERIKSGASIFLSGPGGVGKSVLVRKIREEYGNSAIFLAPTGIAAINIEGSTVHRTFRFPLGFLGNYQRNNISDAAREVLSDEKIKVLVIDEISMVRADLFTAIDFQLKRIRRSRKPFGGLQVVVVGDFFQLPPVINNQSPEATHFYEEFSCPFAFSTDAWKEAAFETVELDKVLRTTDENFIGHLGRIRQKTFDFKPSLDFLNDFGTNNQDVPEDALYLCSTNKDADTINKHNYDEVEGEEFYFAAKVTGVAKENIVPRDLYLKVNCKVLLCANDPEGYYVNGHTGVVTSITRDAIMVCLDKTREIVVVKRFVWKDLDYIKGEGGVDTNVVGTFTQFPMKLGWAVTIHKSQGLSLDSAIIYTGRGCFAHGQVYVGFSRLRSLEGLALINRIGVNEVVVDERVVQFYEDNKSANLFNSFGGD